jgi:hypothetical protein
MIIDKIINYFYKKFNPIYNLDETFMSHLKDYFANSDYFNLKSVKVTKNGFSMRLSLKTLENLV